MGTNVFCVTQIPCTEPLMRKLNFFVQAVTCMSLLLRNMGTCECVTRLTRHAPAHHVVTWSVSRSRPEGEDSQVLSKHKAERKNSWIWHRKQSTRYVICWFCGGEDVRLRASAAVTSTDRTAGRTLPSQGPPLGAGLCFRTAKHSRPASFIVCPLQTD